MIVPKVAAAGETAIKRKTTEWIGGIFEMPAYITGEDTPYQPELLLWVNGQGLVVGTHATGPGQALDEACDHLAETLAAPMHGQQETVTRLRVSSEAFAQALRTGHPDLEVVCAPTPELEEVVSAMHESLASDQDSGSWLQDGIEGEDLYPFFEAAAALYRTQPWSVFESDFDLVSITVKELGQEAAVVTVFGQLGEVYGFGQFATMMDLFCERQQAGRSGGDPGPSCVSDASIRCRRGSTTEGARRVRSV